MYCTNCGSNFEGNFCPECGQKSAKAKSPLSSSSDCDVLLNDTPIKSEQATKTLQTNFKGKRKKGNPGCAVGSILLFVIFLVFVLIMLFSETAEPLINADSLAGYSAEQVVERYGEPVDVDNWNYKGINGTYPLTTYTYYINGLTYEFILFRNELARLTIRSEDGNISYAGNTFEDFFGIEITEDATFKDTGVVYRLNNPGGLVQDLFIININSSEKTFDEVKLTYNTYPFGE